MRNLTNTEHAGVAGAGVPGLADQYDADWWIIPEPAPTYNWSDPALIAIEAATTFVFSCIGGAVKGGVPGCIIAGTIGATGKTVTTLLADAYNSYTSNKK